MTTIQRTSVVKLLRHAAALESYEDGSSNSFLRSAAIQLAAPWEIEELARRACCYVCDGDGTSRGIQLKAAERVERGGMAVTKPVDTKIPSIVCTEGGAKVGAAAHYEHAGGAVKLRVIDALQRADVLDGSKWLALPLPSIGGRPPPYLTLPQQTLGVDPERERLCWCDGTYDPRAVRPSHFGSEALLSLRQLLGDCTLVNAARGVP